MTIKIATDRVKAGLVQNMRFDLSVLLIGSTSSESGNSERLGFQLTYLSGENFEKSVFLPCFLKFDHALSQSVEDLSPETFNQVSPMSSKLCLVWETEGIILEEMKVKSNSYITVLGKQRGIWEEME